jgi:multiple sugar transport system substrate-binding protein
MRAGWSRFAIAFVAALALGACGSGSKDSSSASKATTPTQDAKVDLVYIAHDFKPREAWDKERIAAYQRAHPNVHIKQVVIPYPAFDDKLKAAIVGNQVDIFANETPLGSYFASGAVTPVDWKAMGFASLGALEAKYTDKGLVPFSYQGKPYAIPNEATSYAFFINKKLFRAAGLDPEADYPRTWEQVRSLSRRLVKRDSKGRIVQRGFDFAYPASNNWISPADEYFPLLAQKGGQIVSADGTSSAFDSPGNVAVFKFISDWVHRDKLGGPPADDVTDEFIKGKVAMISIGPWFEPVLKKDAPAVYKNLKVVPFPMFEGGQNFGPQMDGYGHMVNAKSSPDEQREAWKFIAFLDNLNGDPIPYVQRTGLLVPRKEVFAQSDQLAATLKDHQVFLDALNRPQLGLYDQLKASKISDAISNAVDRVSAKNQSPQAAVSQASKEIDAVLNSP